MEVSIPYTDGNDSHVEPQFGEGDLVCHREEQRQELMGSRQACDCAKNDLINEDIHVSVCILRVHHALVPVVPGQVQD